MGTSWKVSHLTLNMIHQNMLLYIYVHFKEIFKETNRITEVDLGKGVGGKLV